MQPDKAPADSLFICLAIATYRRPQALREVLGSLRALELPSNCRVHLLVVDNDPGRSGETIFRECGKAAAFPASYLVEPERGIPHARNRCLAEATRLEADALVFIDDDETPAPQ